LDVIESTLARFDGGRVLDVATLQGRFAQTMRENLSSYDEIIGVDIHEKGIEAAREANEADDVSFAIMNAEALEFEDESFDTVAISASMHHMENLGKVLGEMRRVLKPGGRYIVVEMYRDDPSEQELTSIQMHQWAAEIDEAMGRFHRHTFTKAELAEHLDALDMIDVEEFDCPDPEPDPHDEEMLEHVEKAIDMVSKRAEGLADEDTFVERGAQLRERFRTVGAVREPLVLVTGLKRDDR
jgi:ubiquinone/menaquinone biosynthesis C-methylase UbiE